MTVSLTGVNHLGMTVRDLGRTLAFYRDAFGLEPIIHAVGENADISRSVGLEGEDARIEYAFLDLGNTRIELLQYDRPQGRREYGTRSCDVGAFHVCFDVDDLEAKYAQLKEMGVEFVSEPIGLDDQQGALAGLRYVYLRDPDGLMLQMYEMPR